MGSYHTFNHLQNRDAPVSSRLDRDSSLHFELSYRYLLTNKIFITSGVLLITNPEHNAANGSIWIGLFRTTFTF